jgi:hypothetical protein
MCFGSSKTGWEILEGGPWGEMRNMKKSKHRWFRRIRNWWERRQDRKARDSFEKYITSHGWRRA